MYFSYKGQICGKSADIAFVIDSSSSIHPTNFGKQIDFVKKIVPLYNIGPTATQVSAITFSDGVVQEYGFSDEQTEKAILEKVFRFTRAHQMLRKHASS